MENPIKMDDLGGKPTIFGNIHIYISPIVIFIYNQEVLPRPKLCRDLLRFWNPVQTDHPKDQVGWTSWYMYTWNPKQPFTNGWKW